MTPATKSQTCVIPLVSVCGGCSLTCGFSRKLQLKSIATELISYKMKRDKWLTGRFWFWIFVSNVLRLTFRIDVVAGIFLVLKTWIIWILIPEKFDLLKSYSEIFQLLNLENIPSLKEWKMMIFQQRKRVRKWWFSTKKKSPFQMDCRSFSNGLTLSNRLSAFVKENFSKRQNCQFLTKWNSEFGWGKAVFDSEFLSLSFDAWILIPKKFNIFWNLIRGYFSLIVAF